MNSNDFSFGAPDAPTSEQEADACACRECDGQGRYDRLLAVNGHYEGGEVFNIQCDACAGSGREKPLRESVADALLIVESYGPWGPDLNDAHRRQIVLSDEVKRMTGMSDALQAEWDRECGDTDTILHAIGLDPANCRTDGGSLKVQMIIGALAHREVMLKRDAEQPLRIAIAGAVPAMHSYAAKNPKHHFGEGLQDPCGVHAWLAEFGG